MMAHNRIGKVLIANRGEIALRIQRTCARMGIKTATTVSDADIRSLFARMAENIVHLPGMNAKETYLNSELIIDLAIKERCNSIHPGYGFLSENSDFAQAVNRAGLIFIGPDAKTIALLGDKVEARRCLSKNGVPCTPGCESSEDDDQLIKSASKIGYPVIIKAASGGGGRGMRIAHDKVQLKTELPRARSEALKFFGDSRVYIEKLIERPRHIEVQLLGDKFGNIVHFGTRECSAQRRNQKLIEEAPAPNLPDKVREGIHKAAVKAARAANYDSVGTAEFLLKDDEFYFLEMNTRIQVEHPVTEEVSGVDLIELQIKVAAGERLNLAQKDIKLRGHSIEFRVNAEDCKEKFRPTTGEIGKIIKPSNIKYREEQGFEEGDIISPYYDGLISKIIVNGATRREAILKSRAVLREYRIETLPTTLEFHRWALLQEDFLRSEIDIGYVERNFSVQSVSDLLAREIIDPLHSSPIGDIEKVEFYEHRSRLTNFTYQIKLTHCADATFLAVPLAPNYTTPKEEFCRRSNGLRTALNSLVCEVLEQREPKEIFR